MSGLMALEKMADEADKQEKEEQEATQREAEQQQADADALRMAKAMEKAHQALVMYDAGLKKFKDERLFVPEETYKTFPQQVAPLILKLGLNESVEPPAWLIEYMPYLVALWAIGCLAYVTREQLKELHRLDEEKKFNEARDITPNKQPSSSEKAEGQAQGSAPVANAAEIQKQQAMQGANWN